MLKIGVQSASWYNREDPLASFEYIKSCGFDAVDFNIDGYVSTAKLNKEGLQETFFDQSLEEILAYFTPLKEASEKTGVEISQMHAPFPAYFGGNDELNEYIRMIMDKCFAVCEYVHCPAIVVHPTGGATKEEEWANNWDMYRKLIPIIKKYKGVKICLENLFTTRPNRIEEGKLCAAEEQVKLIDTLNEEAGGDYFGFCFDVGHAILLRKNIRDYLVTMGHRVTILHLHDNNGVDDLHMPPYSYLANGRNHVCNWDTLVEGLAEIGYRGVLAFETFRVFSAYPADVRTDVLKMIASIGRSWSKRIEGTCEE